MDQMNRPGALSPEAQAGPAQDDQGQEKDPRMQKMVDMASKQMLGAMTNPEASRALAQDAKARGPEEAIMAALKEAVTGVQRASGDAGIEVPDEVLEDAVEAVAQVLVTMLEHSGIVKDAAATMQSLMAKMGDTDGSGAGDEHAEPDADEQGGPPDSDADDMAQSGDSQMDGPGMMDEGPADEGPAEHQQSGEPQAAPQRGSVHKPPFPRSGSKAAPGAPGNHPAAPPRVGAQGVFSPASIAQRHPALPKGAM